MRVAKAKPNKTLEQTLWETADKPCGNQEPGEYEHVVLGLVFLKYISDRLVGAVQRQRTDTYAEG